MFNKLCLPKPSEQIVSLVRSLATARPIDESALAWHKKQQPKDINCVAGEFFPDTAFAELVLAEYKDFFNLEVYPLIGVLQNVEVTPACYPPHSDRLRNVAINYYIELGGDDVTTVFYDKTDPIDDKVGGHVLSYDDLPTITNKITFKKNEWYILPSKQYHSVENIETMRIMISFLYIGEVEHFINTHKHLFID
jgi:hypothetical protein